MLNGYILRKDAEKFEKIRELEEASGPQALATAENRKNRLVRNYRKRIERFIHDVFFMHIFITNRWCNNQL